ncbi:MAG: arginine--tRNA ligase [Firmicutes bacterium]|nr:arginine--tRNA ligase [Bacillota bacterium]
MKEKIVSLIKSELEKLGISKEEITIEIPKTKENGDYSTNIALQLARELRRNPLDIAKEIASGITDKAINNVVVAPPGFINFFVTNDYLLENINNVIELGDKYGSCDIGKGQKINIEFVSANPTGILHMGNARGGAYGDSLARIMKFCGYEVTKEYYLNDAGNQINKLANSIYSRYLTKCGIENEFPENGYPGQEIYDIAEIIYSDHQDSLINNDLEIFKKYGVDYLTKQIFKDLEEYRITYDVVTSEKSIYEKHPINNVLDKIRNNGFLYEKEGATWFKSSELLDDKDHVFIKADGSYTYVVPDIPYHMDKIDRGYVKVIDVLGTDHHGYVARLKSAIKAVGYDEEKLSVKLLQLVRIVKNKEVVVMHKRSGNVITLKDLIDEVGVNAARYYFSKSSLDTQMDFDIELAKSKSNDNPVFYVCYAYARICSILNNYNEIQKVDKFECINEEAAYNVLASVYKFGDVVKSACAKEMPHIITNYVYELASLFHTYYEKCRIVSDDEKKTIENLNLIKCIKITLYNALSLIGVIPDERM